MHFSIARTSAQPLPRSGPIRDSGRAVGATSRRSWKRGVSIPEGLNLTARRSEEQEPVAVEEEASNAGIDIAMLGSAIKRAGGTAMAHGTIFVAVESSELKKLVYTCQPVEVCKQVSDPNVWGGKILWGCRTVCVGTGWRVV